MRHLSAHGTCIAFVGVDGTRLYTAPPIFERDADPRLDLVFEVHQASEFGVGSGLRFLVLFIGSFAQADVVVSNDLVFKDAPSSEAARRSVDGGEP